jgi:hypothetical protein
MEINHTPRMSFDASETHCCPPFHSEEWDNQNFEFDDKLFVRGTTVNVFHIPLTMGHMMKKCWAAITAAGANSPDEFVLLSHDPSPWKGEHLFSVTKEVPDLPTVRLSGTFRTKVYEGPYKKVPEWCADMEEAVHAEGKSVEKLYWFYTTCPKCAKHYGKNYVVAFAKVA